MNKLEIASNTLIDMLESTVFIFAEHGQKLNELEFKGWEPIASELKYYGKSSGTVFLFANRSFLAAIAETLLGLDKGSAEAYDMGKGVLKEILNIVVGNFISKYYGTKDVYELGLPTLIEDSNDIQKLFELPDSIWLKTEDGNLLLIVQEQNQD
jgi:hypothetical protein